jgi:SH3 domain protein
MTAMTVSAETVYINDEIFVPVRSGPGSNYRIVHKGIRTGTALEVISVDEEAGYTEVRTRGGLEGFVPNQYLSKEPIAALKLDKAEQALASAIAEKQKASNQLQDLQNKYQALEVDHRQISTGLDQARKELSDIKAISSNALNLDRRNRELHEANEQLRNELELVQTENLRLKDKSDSSMMLMGGGLVLLGVILTLLVPVLKPGRKNDSWA